MSVCAPLYLLIFFPSSTPAPSPNLLTMIIYHLTCPSCCLLSIFLTFHLHSLSFPPCVYCPCPCWLSQRRRSDSELFVLPCKLQWNFNLLPLFKLRFGCKNDAINMYFCPRVFYNIWVQVVQWKLSPESLWSQTKTSCYTCCCINWSDRRSPIYSAPDLQVF